MFCFFGGFGTTASRSLSVAFHGFLAYFDQTVIIGSLVAKFFWFIILLCVV